LAHPQFCRAIELDLGEGVVILRISLHDHPICVAITSVLHASMANAVSKNTPSSSCDYAAWVIVQPSRKIENNE